MTKKGKPGSRQIPPPPPATCDNFFYTVVAGDTLAGISQRFGVRLADILIANPQIMNPDVIYAGQVICIPLPIPPDVCKGCFYTVMPGDTLFSIAQSFGLTVQQLLAANPQIINPDIIYAGQKICIPKKIMPPKKKPKDC